MNKLKSGQGFAPISLVIVVVFLSLAMIYVYVAHRHNSSGNPPANNSQSAKEFSTSSAYYDTSRSEEQKVVEDAKQQVSKIQFSGTVQIDEGNDSGCTIFPSGTFGGTHAVNCDYSYLRFYTPVQSQTEDLKALFKQIQAAGWTKSSGASVSRYQYFLADPSYMGAFPIDLENPNSTKLTSPISLRLSVIDARNADSGFFDGKGYPKVLQAIKPGSYVIGYELYYRYVQANCNNCSVNYGL